MPYRLVTHTVKNQTYKSHAGHAESAEGQAGHRHNDVNYKVKKQKL